MICDGTTTNQRYFITGERFEWTTESFNERTGNRCKEFRANKLNNEVI